MLENQQRPGRALSEPTGRSLQLTPWPLYLTQTPIWVYILAVWFQNTRQFSCPCLNNLEKRTQTFSWQIGHLLQVTSYTDYGYINKSERHSRDSSLSAISVHSESKRQILILLRIKSTVTEPKP